MILVLAGTTEGRKKAACLEKAGEKVIAATATAYGGVLLNRFFKGEIISRPLSLAEIEALITERKITKIIDATHPYAEEITKNALAACQNTATEYERVERPACDYSKDEFIIEAEDASAAARIALPYPGKVFLTIGTNKLHHFTKVIEASRLVVRILPVFESLAKCLALGISPANIIAMQGPFDEALNEALYRHFQAAVVVSKESGQVGGTAAKIEAAKKMGLPLILIRRPKSDREP